MEMKKKKEKKTKKIALQKCKGYFNLGVVISVASIQWDVHLNCMHDFLNTLETEVESVGSPQV